MLPTKKTSSVLIAAALLGSAIVGAAPAASARTAMKTFSVTFAYNTAEPAQKIYANLTDTARKACRDHMPMAYHVTMTMRSCTKNVVEAALKAMTRTDVASLHYNRNV